MANSTFCTRRMRQQTGGRPARRGRLALLPARLDAGHQPRARPAYRSPPPLTGLPPKPRACANARHFPFQRRDHATQTAAHHRHRQLSVSRLARICLQPPRAFGADDVAEMLDDAVVAAIHDQVTAGLDVITDGEQTRLDFNLSFYGLPRRHRTSSGSRRAASARPPTTSAASMPSPANSPRPMASASSRNSSACSAWPRPAPRSRPAFPAPTR